MENVNHYNQSLTRVHLHQIYYLGAGKILGTGG